MAKKSRVLNNRQDTYYHIPLKAVGTDEDRPFGPAERKAFRVLLEEIALYYTIRVVNVAFLGNHVHLVLLAPATPPRKAVAMRLWHAYYEKVKTRRARPNWDDPQVVGLIALGMRSISHFVKQFKHRSAVWFNHSRPVPRHGSLWCNRFKSIIVNGSAQLRNLIRYVDLNPARAGMVNGPRAGQLTLFGSLLDRQGSPFQTNYLETLRLCWEEPCTHLDDGQLLARHGRELSRILAGERGASPAEMDRYLCTGYA